MSRDETHDIMERLREEGHDIDTWVHAARETIMERLREEGHDIATWAQARLHFSAASDGKSSPPPPPHAATVAAETAPAANEPAAGAGPLADTEPN
jgi:hypothetical protein